MSNEMGRLAQKNMQELNPTKNLILYITKMYQMTERSPIQNLYAIYEL